MTTTNFSLEFKDNNVPMFTLKFDVHNSVKLLTKAWLSTDTSETDILLPVNAPSDFYNGAQLLYAGPAIPSFYNGFNVYNTGYTITNTVNAGTGNETTVDAFDTVVCDNAFDFSNEWKQFDSYGVIINPNTIPYFQTKYPGKVFSVLRIFSTSQGLETGTSSMNMHLRIYERFDAYSPPYSIDDTINSISTTLINLTTSGGSSTGTPTGGGGSSTGTPTGGGGSSTGTPTGGGGSVSVVANPCFNEGTKILCLNQENNEYFVEIEKLNKGNLVKTYLHGYKKVEMVGKNTMMNDTSYPISSNCMYVLRKEKFSELTEDLTMTGNHSILVNELTEKESWVQNIIRTKEEKIEDKKLLLTAACEKVEQVKNNNKFTYYHIVLENENKDSKYGIYANGLLCETISENEFNKHDLIKTTNC